ncbi:MULTISPECIES: hypothetical protein [unclassified Streptosporangium]|nr:MULTISPECIES: hypothetical protein [unclassified Streptosporangium]
MRVSIADAVRTPFGRRDLGDPAAHVIKVAVSGSGRGPAAASGR